MIFWEVNKVDAYSSYQPCLLPWIKQIPASWEITKNKCVFVEAKSLVGDESEKYTLLSLSLDGVIPRDISSRKGKFPQSFAKYKIVKENDLAFCLFDIDETPRTVGLVNQTGMLTGAYDIFHVHGANPKYLYYYYLALDNIKALRYYYSGLRKTVSTPIFLSMDVPLPSVKEQEKIVLYLDWKVSSINRIILLTKQKIKILNEQKRSVINHIVTGESLGEINYRESKIEGLGKIPDSWTVGPLKHFVRSNLESLSGKTEADYEFDYIDISTVGYGFLKTAPVHYHFEEAPSRARRIVRKGDTIISTVRTYLRSICYIDEELDGKIASTGFSVLTPNGKIIPELLNSVLSANYFINSVVKSSVGTSYPAITDDKLMNLRLAVPSTLSEQQRLINEINENTASIEMTVRKLNHQLKLFVELRNKTMLDAVLGVVDLSNIEIPQYNYCLDIEKEHSEVDEEE